VSFRRERAIGVAVHDAGDGRESSLVERIGALLGTCLELPRIRHELARDRIARILPIDQPHHVRRDRNRIPRRHRLERRRVLGRNEACPGKAGNRSQGFALLSHG
jgi:hypothetical protein